MEENQITYIGKVDYRNKLTKFGIKAEDRTKHMYVIGKTGTGKSTFLENMIVQDIQNGNGCAFLDPHGGSIDKLLDYIPEWRMNDVIYFNPSDMEFPIAFNPLEDVGPDRRHLVADGLMSVFEKIWPEAFSGRMTYILNNTMLALLEYPDSTLLGINRMLTDKEFRKRVVANLTDPTVKNAWDELMKWDDKTWRDAVAALVNKVGQFTTNPVIRNIIGQSKSTFDFRKAMDERKIILINLSKGMIGEQNAPLIGAMLITKIYLAAMSRAELSQQAIKSSAPFYFYVDEFQNFANDSFASILSEARKYKLCLTVANQYIAQMEETIRDAVFGNMGTTVAFRVGPLDAEFVERVFAPVFTQEDLQNVMFGQYYISLQIDRMGSKPFSAQGLPPIPPLQTSIRDRVIESSRRQFTRPRAEVNQMVIDWFGYSKPAGDDKNIVRSEGGSKTAFTQNTPQAKKFEPKTFDQPRQQKPLPPILGAKNPGSVPAPTSQIPAPVAQKPKIDLPPAPKKDSAALSNLLGKLDQAVVQEKPNTSMVAKDEIVMAPIPTFKPEPVAPAPKPIQQPMARAATPEKKNALAEALAKAMEGKKEEKKEAVTNIEQPVPKSQPSTFKPTQTPREIPENILRQVLE